MIHETFTPVQVDILGRYGWENRKKQDGWQSKVGIGQRRHLAPVWNNGVPHFSSHVLGQLLQWTSGNSRVSFS